MEIKSEENLDLAIFVTSGYVPLKNNSLVLLKHKYFESDFL